MKGKQFLANLFSIAFCATVFCCVVHYHQEKYAPPPFQQESWSPGAGRVLSSTSSFSFSDFADLIENGSTDSNNGPDLDDDSFRDEKCRQHLTHFLNGTTDGNDYCRAMHTAWDTSDCEDEAGFNSFWGVGGSSTVLRNVAADNSTTAADDDVSIDDMFETIDCCTSISTYYTKHCEQEQLDATRLFGIVAVLIVCGLMKSLIRVSGWRWIPDAGACILVGAVCGGALRILNPDVVSKRLTFNNNLFLQILLPPIIFEAALSIDKRAFRRDLFPILTFAIIGTGVSAVAIGLITHYLSSLGAGTQLPYLDSLLFGALMSSIDPVATLSILSGVGVEKGDTVYTLVFGESLLNDGAAIVLFDSLLKHMGDGDVVDDATIHNVLLNFTFVTAGSIAVGWFCGTCCNFYFWALQGMHSAVTEGSLFFTWALVPYYIADAFEFSGIISIMVMGFMLDYYVVGGQHDVPTGEWAALAESDIDGNEQSIHPIEPAFERFKVCWNKAFSGTGHLCEHARSHVGFVAEVISSIVETAIFAYLGLFLFNDKSAEFMLTGTGIFACVASRAAMVIALCIVINICVWIDLESNLTHLWRMIRGRSDTFGRPAFIPSEKNFLGPRTQFILFTAGIRGAVSYALVQNIPVYDSVTKHGSHFKPELRAMTSATIVGLLFVFGALTYFSVDRSTPAGSHRTRTDGTLTQLLMEESHLPDNVNIIDPNAEAFEIDTRRMQVPTNNI